MSGARPDTGPRYRRGPDRLTLYSHPQVLHTVDHDGGWTAKRIDEAWRETLGAQAQPSGPRQEETSE